MLVFILTKEASHGVLISQNKPQKVCVLNLYLEIPQHLNLQGDIRVAYNERFRRGSKHYRKAVSL